MVGDYTSNLISYTMRCVLENTQDFMFVKDRNLVYVGASKAFAVDCACRSGVEDVIGKTDYEVFEDPSYAAKYRKDDEELLLSGTSKIEYREAYPGKDGRNRYCLTTKYLIRDAAGEPAGVFGQSRDVTEQVRLERQDDKNRKKLDQNATIFSALCDVYDICMYWNLAEDTYFRVYGNNDGIKQVVPDSGNLHEVLQAWLKHDLSEENRRQSAAYYDLSTLAERLSEVGVLTMEIETISAGWMRTSLVPAGRNQDGTVYSCLWVGEVIDEEKKKEIAYRKALEEASRIAETDALTGLFNRGGSEHRLIHIIQDRTPGLLCMFDINDFKHTNDRYGHLAGDYVLKQIALCMKKIFHEQDILARFGGDEFVIFSPEITTMEAAQDCMNRLVDEVEKEAHAEIGNEHIHISLGAFLYDGRGSVSFGDAYEKCDTAMYNCKAQNDMPYQILGAEGVAPVCGKRLNGYDTKACGSGLSEYSYSKKSLGSLFNKVPAGIVMYEWDGSQMNTLYVSNYFTEQYGDGSTAEIEDFQGGLDFSKVHPDDQEGLKEAMSEAEQKTHQLDYVYRIWSEERKRYEWTRLRAVLETQPDGTAFIYALYFDVTAQKEAEMRLEESHEILCAALDASPGAISGASGKLSYIGNGEGVTPYLMEKLRYDSEHDALTGLYNRKRFMKECERMLRAYPEEQFAMIHFDMKNFHRYNTFFGDQAGDRLLCDLAGVLRMADGDYDHWVYGRMESDVFCSMVPFNQEIYEKHTQATFDYLKDYRDDYLLEPKFGLYLIKDHDMSIESMITRAAIAAKKTQPSVGNALMVFTDEMEEQLQIEQSIVNEMQGALEQGQFQVYLQPKYALHAHQPVGAEALARWVHPTKGLISPADFIPIFEKNGFITNLDRYMWEQVCVLLRKWMDEGKPVNPISVNVSRVSIFGPNTVAFIKELTEKYQIEPKYLELELTESAYIENPEEIKPRLLELQAYGFKILMDDFGSGYSSLNTLKDLPVDILKLDMRFLSASEDEERGALVLSSIVHMSKLLGLPVIAEGVESKKQEDYLQRIGCEYVQGFLFAPPMPVAEYEKNQMEVDE